ncbi:transposase [Variovorax robiniae]|uniref:Transposase n=1 Tax=Variovorax robiniae TaxID=1836199 RepID=A0ABU8X5W6_9BURK
MRAHAPIAFLGTTDAGHEARHWRGTLVRDEYSAYDSVAGARPGRLPAGCLAHAGRKFDQLLLESGRRS